MTLGPRSYGMAAAISSRPACSRSLMMTSIGCPGNNSARACSRAASSSSKRIAYSLAVRTGTASFFQRSSKGLYFTTTPPYQGYAHYRPQAEADRRPRYHSSKQGKGHERSSEQRRTGLGDG